MKTVSLIITIIILLSVSVQGQKIGVETSNPEQTLHVEGKIKISDDNNAPTVGSIRWNDIEKTFQGYNGTQWLSFYRSPDTWGWKKNNKIDEDQKITADDAAYRNHFVIAVDIDGDYIVIGAYNVDDNGDDSGAAYIYIRTNSGWVQQTKLLASDGSGGDIFGRSVSISGSYAIVGAYGDDDSGSNSGSAYIFYHDGSNWSEQAKLTASDGAAEDNFGYSVSIDDQYAMVGANYDDDNGSSSGSAYIFYRDGSNWTEQAKLTASDGASGDRFGSSVSISGTYALVGAEADNVYSGSAYFFDRSGSTWTEVENVGPTGAPTGNDVFGCSVSIAGDVAIVGAVGDDDMQTNAGAAYIFNRSGTDWNFSLKLLPMDGQNSDFFGRSVAIDGEYAIIGANGGSESGAGGAYVFHGVGSNWTQQIKLIASDPERNDDFGYSVSIDGETVIIGAYEDNDVQNSAGSAYIFNK